MLHRSRADCSDLPHWNGSETHTSSDDTDSRKVSNIRDRSDILVSYVHSRSSEPHEISDISLPSNVDIRINLTQPAVDGGHRPRPRASGKLLTSIQGVGLALLRLEQVESVEKGDAKFIVEQKDGETTSMWNITPWRPAWWPAVPPEAEEE